MDLPYSFLYCAGLISLFHCFYVKYVSVHVILFRIIRLRILKTLNYPDILDQVLVFSMHCRSAQSADHQFLVRYEPHFQ